MNKSQVIDTFNKQFMEFIIDIERVFPNDTDITSTRKSISKSLMIMPKTLIRLFNDHFVSIYSNEIENGDLGFFIENDYRKKHGYKENEDVWVLDKIDILRKPVQNMSPDEKLKIVQYMKNLKKLSDLYNTLKKK
jgi:hypothetical protein